MKLFFATPCYGGQVTSVFASGLLDTAGALVNSNVEGLFYLSAGESLITRGRNYCVHEFLKRKDCSHLFFIDADIKFTPADVKKVVEAGLDVCAGAYPLKNIEWERVDEARKKGLNPAEHASQIVVNAVDGFGVGMGEVVEVKECGTGFMCIKREVIEKMIAAYPECIYVDDGPGRIDGERLRIPRLFHADIVDDVIDDKPAKRYLSEDYWFCRKWRELGGKVYLHLGVRLGHMGAYLYQASPHQIHNGPEQGLQVQRDDAERVMSILSGKLDPQLPEDPTRLIDNSAREGTLAIWASRRWPGIELHVYEPDKSLREMLVENLKAYQVNAVLHDQPIPVMPMSLVHRDGKLEMEA